VRWPWNVPSAVTPPAAAVTFTNGDDATNRRMSQLDSDNSWLLYSAATASAVAYTANKPRNRRPPMLGCAHGHHQP